MNGLVLIRQNVGAATYTQLGKEVVLSQGDLTLLDQGNFYKVSCATGMEYLRIGSIFLWENI